MIGGSEYIYCEVCRSFGKNVTKEVELEWWHCRAGNDEEFGNQMFSCIPV